MEAKTGAEKKQLISLLQGSDAISINRVLAREPSIGLGQSSRIYYRKPEGVPFNWEMQPGTPINRPEEEAIPPLSPPPQVLSLGLPKPCVDHLTDELDHSKAWFWKKIKIIYKDKKTRAQASKESDPNIQDKDYSEGDFVASSFNNTFTASSSSLSSSSSNGNAVESSGVVSGELLEGSFCCSPWNISKILDEGSRKVYYCRIHKAAFAVENDGCLVGKILPRVSSVGHSFRSYYRSSDGIPFKWEMQPGTPMNPPENELIPPPSPPPAVQSLGLTLPNLNDSDEETEKSSRSSKMVKIWFWITNKKMQGTEKVGGIRCLRLDNNATVSGCLVDDDRKCVESNGSIAGGRSCSSSSSISSPSSNVSVPRSNSLVKVSKFRRDFLGGYFCFHPSTL
ncbi:OLC1v1035148C1 [Oldenlandia corymbosa var. corymbosa]|uniref:OLC1v1035148C1 n=1 Tax=Oldenlandia corymbosa var. corymbosa TaxID=529605 RepID=A0AAV1CS95_OLDCO|nr:OLC1v1035148C1 [Oldenlandia corymbosa var. corymbosa]